MDDEREQPYEPLTERELEILSLIADGMTNQQIADYLFLTLETIKWHNRHTYQKLRVRNRTQAVARARELRLLDTMPESRRPSREKKNLPTQTTLFVGRKAELAEIQQLLLNEAGCRLLTLIGPGGIGKTRLALAATAPIAASFPEGVYFVPLNAVDEVAFLAPAIAEVLHVTFYGQSAPTEQLLHYLQAKKLLLVLDNFEHLLEGASLLSEILRCAPDVSVLVTSRERLRLQGEWVYEVQGLPYPAEDLTVPDLALETYEAIQLFVQRARQTDASFVAGPDELLAIIRICQLVEGMPLGLELAAPWIRSLRCHEIASEIERSLDFLTATLHDLPKRHQSLRTVIERTWQRLPSNEQAILRQLSVFRSGCTRQAAQAVTGATLPDLSSLIDKALLHRTNVGRYELHELLRQFSEEALREDALKVQTTRERHCAHYAEQAQQWGPALKTAQQLNALVAIEADIENYRAAWQWALAHHLNDRLEQLSNLWLYFEIRGHVMEGRDWFESTVRVLDHEDSIGLAKVLAALGVFYLRVGPYDRSRAVSERSVAILERCGALEYAPLPLFTIGNVMRFTESPAAARDIYKRAVDIARAHDDKWSLACGLNLVGTALAGLGQLEEATAYVQGSLSILRQIGDRWGMSFVLFDLGNWALASGNYVDARAYLDETMEVAQSIEQRMLVAGVETSLGELWLAEQEYQQAEQSFWHSLNILREMGTRDDTRQSLVGLGETVAAQGRLHEARDHFRAAVKVGFEFEVEMDTLNMLRRAAEALARAGEPLDAEPLVVVIDRLIAHPAADALIANKAQALHDELEDSLGGQEALKAARAKYGELDLASLAAILLLDKDRRSP